ncbi:acetyl-CoA acyltransferase [Geodermatophilus normandii]|uniref:Acetyl-CoA acyltransferase n=1 Tax=Geodermatophilus normandii TaxID=1137989 RepID=A0A317QEQ7_9ACTN|nr:thiolase family protein [Geodermatophilus normandii]PWW21194.1 acetyl-CoA acyltransferase [Geodermatophilus normandii]
MRDAVIVEAVRTPVGKGKPGGSLSGVHPVDLLAHTLETLVERAGLDAALVDDVVAGCVSQNGEQAANVARTAALAAGFPESVPGTTVDRQCGSSQQALSFAAQAVLSGAQDLVVAAGVESMSRVPMGSSVRGADPAGERFAARYPEGMVGQGISAELIAARWDLSRARLDEYAALSHQRAARAWADGRFDRQVVPVEARQADGSVALVTSDESVRPGTDVDVLSRLRPAFADDAMAARFPGIDWRVTPGNSSPLNDGAAALLVTTSERARELGLTPRVRIHTTTVVGDDPLLKLTAVVPATARVLQRAGLTLDDVDLFEVNEAFASVVLAWQAETGVPTEKLNVYGGGISIGHPLGASGARIATTLVDAMHDRGARYALQTMCEAGGLADATVFERL